MDTTLILLATTVPLDIVPALTLIGVLAVSLFIWTRWFKPSLGVRVAANKDIYLRGPDDNGTIRAVDQYGNTLETYFKEPRSIEEKEPRSIEEEVAYDKAMSWILTYNKAAGIVVGKPADAKTRALIQGNLDKIWSNLLSILKTKEDAQVWLETPSADLSGEKPIDLINIGHSESVLALLENAMLGVPS